MKYKILLFVLLVVVVGGLAGYYVFKNTETSDVVDTEPSATSAPAETSFADKLEQCLAGKNFSENVDGVLRNVEGDFLSIELSRSGKLRVFAVTPDTVYKQIIMSPDFEVLEEKDLVFEDLAPGNDLSVVVVCNNDTLNKYIVSILKKIVVKE